MPFRLTPPPPPTPPKEHDVSAQITAFLEERGWYVVRNHVGPFVPYQRAATALRMLIEAMRRGGDPDLDAIWKYLNANVSTMGEKGMSDLLIVHPVYRPFWSEIKAPGHELAEHQQVWADRMKLRGFITGWFDSFEAFVKRYREHVGTVVRKAS